VTQAINIAKQMPGTPVKLLWSREEDMVQGRYHPIMQCKLVGGFDAANNLTGLHMRLSGQSILKEVRPAIVEQQKDATRSPSRAWPMRGALISATTTRIC
jgi:isoquinoline 1-oxidoreductase beta subunit